MSAERVCAEKVTFGGVQEKVTFGGVQRGACRVSAERVSEERVSAESPTTKVFQHASGAFGPGADILGPWAHRASRAHDSSMGSSSLGN